MFVCLFVVCMCTYTVCAILLVTLIVPPSFLGAFHSMVECEEEQTTPTVAETSYEMGEVEGARNEGREGERKWFGCVAQ